MAIEKKGYKPVYLVDDHIFPSKMTRAYSLDNARASAIKYLIQSKHSEVGIFRQGNSRAVGLVRRTIASDTPFCWITERKGKLVTYDLKNNGKLGEIWGKRWGH